MNKYMPWWEKTITVYNKYIDSTTSLITWYKHTIKNCFVKTTGGNVQVGEVTLKTDDVIVRIPQQSDFLESYIWKTKPNDDMGNYFTLSIGDIIIFGDVSDTIDEYTAGHRSTDVIKKYKSLQGCITVNTIGINVGTQVVHPHYYVRGI